MGDDRRHDLFSKVVARNLDPTRVARVADVAGGKGVLSKKLRVLGFKSVVTFDKRKTSRHKRSDPAYRNYWFTADEEELFDAVVAMHPDQGTDHSILYGARRRVPVIVCPCCVLPHAEAYRGPKRFEDWISHLKKIAARGRLDVQEAQLPMRGRNLVLIMRPR